MQFSSLSALEASSVFFAALIQTFNLERCKERSNPSELLEGSKIREQMHTLLEQKLTIFPFQDLYWLGAKFQKTGIRLHCCRFKRNTQIDLSPQVFAVY